MHIKNLINHVLPHIPFRTVSSAQAFLDGFNYDDQLALISAQYVGSSHSQLNELMDDYVDTDRSHCDHIDKDEFAQVLYKKNTELANHYHYFLICGASEPGYLDRF